MKQFILFSSLHCRQEEKKIKPQLSEDFLKDERVLDLQKKIAEKSMERKMQTQNFKSAPAKYSERSRKLPKVRQITFSLVSDHSPA